MRSVDWAQCGIGGLGSTIDDVYATTLGAEVHLENLLSELGKAWAICDGYHKIFACCQYAHSAVEATLALLADMTAVKGREEIRKVVVETHPRGLTLNNYCPETTLAAKFSMPHIVAATFVFGHAGVEAFDSSALASPEITKLRDRVELRRFQPEQAWPHDRPARVIVEFENGERMARECLSARGGPDRPLSTEEILEKISHLTEQVYPNFAPTIVEILALDPASKTRHWEEIVAQLTRGDLSS
jgi:2-methylcitrate dehydratase PrpD